MSNIQMKAIRFNRYRGLFPLLLALLCSPSTQAEEERVVSSADTMGIQNRVFKSDYRIHPDNKGELRLGVDNISFFKDNEYSTSVMKGYTLPGFWIRPTVSYNPLSNMKLELGVNVLRYWGADGYPNMAYRDIAYWKGDNYSKGVHITPIFRAQLALSKRVNIVLGSLYGGSNHNLIEPLYNPELNLTADPEMGLQVLYNSPVFDLDAWVNWESFIFRDDTHQEAFTVGLSSKVKLNRPDSKFHFYIPVQAMVQHRGGEIDTLYTHSVQTLMNGSVGVGAVWNINHPIFKNVNVELDGVGYFQQAGVLWPFDTGAGLYARASADIRNFRVKGSFFACHNYISMFGLPFYGAVSTKEPGATFKNPKVLYLGAEYSHTFAKGFSLGVDVDVYNTFATEVTTPQSVVKEGSSFSFSAGVYLRMNPSFLLKKF